MEMLVDFPGGDKVEAHFGGFSVRTDQPPPGGGEASAPTPFEMFLASLATCAGIYALRFCRRRGLSTEGLVIKQHSEQSGVTGMVEKVALEVVLPGGFPAKYREALINAIELCTVKKHLEQPPAFEITTK
jgi:ribosomal protein S12 methylthiotransferase accessory factor